MVVALVRVGAQELREKRLTIATGVLDRGMFYQLGHE